MTTTARPSFATAQIARAKRVPISRWVTIAALALITAQVALRGLWVSQSWFYSDDFLFLGDVGHGDDTTAWYFRFHFSHFMPLSFVLVKLATLFGPFNWTAAAIQIVVMQLGASLAAWWMLRTVFGNRPGILVPLTFFLFSAMTVPSVMWWAVAINQLPHQIAVFGAIAAHTLYLRAHRRRHIALTALFMLVGYATYTKTMLLPIVLVMFTLTYFARGNLGQRIVMSARRDWGAWVVHGTMLVAYVVAYVLRQPGASSVDFRGDPIGLGFDTIAIGLVPAMIGGPLRWVDWTFPVTVALPSELLIVSAWVVLAGVIGYLALTRTRVLRALLIPAVYLAISIALIYVGRFYIINFLGPFYISRHMQYLADTAAIVTLAIGLMCFHVPGSVESSQRRIRPLLTTGLPRVAVAALGVLIVTGYLVSSSRFAQPWTSEFPQRQFFEKSIAAIEKEHPVLADTAIPGIGISMFLHPHNMPGVAFSPIADSYTVASIGNDLQVLRDDASIAYAMVDGGVRTARDPALPCAYRVQGKQRSIPLVPVVNFPLWIGIDYVASADAQVPVQFGDKSLLAPIEEGRHTLFISASADYDSITLHPQPGQEICVSAVRVGGLKPKGPA